jgi:hypothetical protein
MLDRIEQAGEVPRRMGRSHRDHEYILSVSLRIYAYDWRPGGGGHEHRAIMSPTPRQLPDLPPRPRT